MTEIEYEGQKVKKLNIVRLGENFVLFNMEMENGQKRTVGYFREET